MEKKDKTDLSRTSFRTRTAVNSQGKLVPMTYHHAFTDTKIANRLSGEIVESLRILGKDGAKGVFKCIDPETGKPKEGILGIKWFIPRAEAGDVKDREKQVTNVEFASDFSHAIIQLGDEYYRVDSNNFSRAFGAKFGAELNQLRSTAYTLSHKSSMKALANENPSYKPYYEALYGKGANFYDTWNSTVFPSLLESFFDKNSGNQQIQSESGTNDD